MYVLYAAVGLEVKVMRFAECSCYRGICQVVKDDGGLWGSARNALTTEF
jgi:hypothetical protein